MENIKLLLYCGKDKRGYLHFDTREEITRKYYLSPDSSPFGTYEPDNYLNGKILAECDYEVEEIIKNELISPGIILDVIQTKLLQPIDLSRKSCLSYGELKGRLQNSGNGFYGYSGYVIHIKNLNIFDKPRELSEYWKKGERVKNAPKNMMLVQNIYEDKVVISLKEIKEIKVIKVERYILISVSPEEMCRILNGEQTIIIRKKVLKEML